jgi:hypothetical protein
VDEPEGIAVVGSDLFVLNNFTGTIGEYTTSTGQRGEGDI